ncbi:MAG TPA: hypothetical protein VNG13_08820 [Mycobacteriales bacterium]|nr:hypothetical protein [Mycobacteriales bacterium]
MTEPADVDALAASIRADSADLSVFLEVLAAKFEDALPNLTTVDRSGGRFGRRSRVERVSVGIGDRKFLVARASTGVTSEIVHEVRGVRLSGDQVDFDTWSRALATELALYATAESRGREALSRLLS